MGYIAFSKSLNGHQVGCDSMDNNRSVLENYFKEYDISTYIDPKYDFVNFFDILKNKKLSS